MAPAVLDTLDLGKTLWGENREESAHFMQSEKELTPTTQFLSREADHDVVLKNLKFQHCQTQHCQPP
jgi:hypothetical protein